MIVHITSPDIIGIQKLFERYLTLPDRDTSVNTLAGFYDFLRKNTYRRKIFLDQYCEYEFMFVDRSIILKLIPKND